MPFSTLSILAPDCSAANASSDNAFTPTPVRFDILSNLSPADANDNVMPASGAAAAVAMPSNWRPVDEMLPPSFLRSADTCFAPAEMRLCMPISTNALPALMFFPAILTA